jgi:hypothetical protein
MRIDLTLSAIRNALKRAVALKDQSEQEVSQTVSILSARLSAVEEIGLNCFIIASRQSLCNKNRFSDN